MTDLTRWIAVDKKIPKDYNYMDDNCTNIADGTSQLEVEEENNEEYRGSMFLYSHACKLCFAKSCYSRMETSDLIRNVTGSNVVYRAYMWF